MGTLDDRIIKEALLAPPPGLGTGTGEPAVEVIGPDGEKHVVPANVGVFHAVLALGQQLQQISLRLDALHHHLSNPERKAKDNRETCLVCAAQKQTLEQAIQQATEQAEQQVADAVAQELGLIREEETEQHE